jgi:hypothetical protein
MIIGQKGVMEKLLMLRSDQALAAHDWEMREKYDS